MLMCIWSEGHYMVLVKLLELVGNHIYMCYINCFLPDSQVVLYQILY
jgi:hypothetical protein